MAGRFTVKVNPAGVVAVLTGDGVTKFETEMAQDIADAAGPGMEVIADPSPNRARVSVVTATYEARVAEATDRALTRAVDSGRR